MTQRQKRTPRASLHYEGWRAWQKSLLLPVAGEVFLLTLPFIERGYRKLTHYRRCGARGGMPELLSGLWLLRLGCLKAVASRRSPYSARAAGSRGARRMDWRGRFPAVCGGARRREAVGQQAAEAATFFEIHVDNFEGHVLGAVVAHQRRR